MIWHLFGGGGDGDDGEGLLKLQRYDRPGVVYGFLFFCWRLLLLLLSLRVHVTTHNCHSLTSCHS